METGKTISLVFLLVLASFTWGLETQDYKAIGSVTMQDLDKLSPYMQLNKDNTVTFNMIKAKNSKLPSNLIATGLQYQKFHNKVMAEIGLKGINGVAVEQLPEAQPFTQVFANAKNQSQITPLVNGVDTICGGGFLRPHTCPARINSGVYKNTVTEVRSYLKNIGYHNTYSPGCGSGGPCPNDFTKWVNANSCTWGSFRTQALAIQSGSRWTYWTQTPEPNPEINNYSWPIFWWGPYVAWWHSFYC